MQVYIKNPQIIWQFSWPDSDTFPGCHSVGLCLTPIMSQQHILPLPSFLNLLTQAVCLPCDQHLFLGRGIPGHRKKGMVMSAYIVQLKHKAGFTTVNAAFTYLLITPL